MKSSRLLLPRIEYILLMALFWGIAANGPRILNFDGDLPRHLLLGRLIRETKSVPLTDTFSFRTEGFPSIPHEWLSQVLFSAANDLLGLNGVVLLTALIVAATWGIVFQQARCRTDNLFATVTITTLAIAAGMIHVLPRPHLFTYLLTVVWITTLERVAMRKPNFWWLLPILMLLWVNLHGMFVLGIILWAIHFAGNLLDHSSREWFAKPSTKSMMVGGGLALIATFVSPSGPGIWKTIISLGGNSYITSRIPEYQSADFHMPETWFFILLLLVTVAALGRSAHRHSWTDILSTVAFLGLALYTSRMIPLFSIVIAPIATGAIGNWLEQEYPSSRFVETGRSLSKINFSSNGSVWLVIFLIAMVVILQSGRTIDPQGKGNTFDEVFFPVQAVDWLNQNPQQGRMFNEFDWGGYLLLKLSPRQPIFMDGHTHIYGEALTREYERIISLGDGWQDILDWYQIQWVIVRTGSTVARGLQGNNWKVLYQDETSIILRRP